MSIFVFTSGSSVLIGGSRASSHAAAHGGSGTVSVSVNGVSLKAFSHLEPEGLRVVVTGSDSRNPTAAPFRQVLILKEGERRMIDVPAGGGDKSAERFTIARIGDGVQVFANSG